MSRKVFHKLIDSRDVERIILSRIDLKPLGVEEVELRNALGRVLAEDIYAPIDYPPFDRSEVDGYAVRAEDTYGADELHSVKLSLIGEVEAGEKPLIEVKAGEAVEVATGSMIPRGATGVVMEEYVKRSGSEVIVYKSIVPGENIVTAGSDINLGDLVIAEGTMITPREVALLAGLGIWRLKVYRKVRAAVFSTGREVVEPWEELVDGMIYDVNGHLISSSLINIGVEAKFLGLLPDNYDSIMDAVSKALEEHDVVITSGSTSAGLGDLIYRVFESLGEVVIHGLKVKPGKPTVIAISRGKLLIGLPGFPLSCFIVFNEVIKPLIVRLTGLRSEAIQEVKARINYRIRKPLGVVWFYPVLLINRRGEYIALPAHSRSGDLSPLITCDGYAVLDPAKDLVIEGDEVTVRLFHDRSRVPLINVVGSNDPILYRLLSIMGLAQISRVLSIGSTGGWLAIRNGEADIAPTHLLDEETLTYNTPFLHKYRVLEKAVLVRGYDRRIGLVVSKGNPKNVRSIRDFIRSNVVIVNRPRGAGVRVYLDLELGKLAKELGLELKELAKSIKGYNYEVKSHTAVALAVKHGRADVGIAVEYVAKQYGLDFLPLTWEQYDFLVNKESLEKKEVQKFIESLRNSEVIKTINSTPGYRAPENIGFFMN
ncbi:MAG: molybdopterin biosynthesis protein [Sulfolobales archaeon]|nr:molybdopterin biosynthesis protein [Sulfolobales archaeon]MCX8198473.1 molybdopterin biosynthesis protein [Sulfolobales archaeon]MDW8169548.1 molybdopterin biosynthesis protein [Desulfurococcaceae archaeon]